MIKRIDFFNNFKIKFNMKSLTQNQVDGIEAIFHEWELSENTDMRWLAYALATTWHETARTMWPITEYGSQKYLRSKKYWPYIGRGFVQLTWKYNYEKYGIADEPELALDLTFASHVLIHGMVNGIFTGKKLSNYFSETKNDPIGARKIINGTDKAELIAGYYHKFLDALNYTKGA